MTMSTLTLSNPLAKLRVDAEIARIFKPITGKNREDVFFEQRNFRKTHRAMCKAFPELFETRPNPVISDADILRIKDTLDDYDEADIDLVLAWWTATPHYLSAEKKHRAEQGDH